jgi:hypothetical protein
MFCVHYKFDSLYYTACSNTHYYNKYANAYTYATLDFKGSESFWLIPGTFDDEMNLLY